MSHIEHDKAKELIFDQLCDDLGREPTEQEVNEEIQKRG